ncbi:MAG: nucleotide exchange factor GrpE [Mitsuokella sp.]
MKEEKKKDAQKMEEMQREIDEAEANLKADETAEEEAVDEADAQEEAQAETPEEEAETLRAEVERLTADLKEKEDRVLRLQADFENFRRRVSKERIELADVVKQDFLKDMLPLVDNFERAMAAEKTDGEAFQKGVEMIYTQFGEILKKNGLEPIETEGRKFDPNFHQAVMRVADPELEDERIVKELQRGYTAHGRVLRPSMVQVVSN